MIEEQKQEDYYVSEYDYIVSRIGRAYFSGMDFDDLWDCLALAGDSEQLDAAIVSTIDLKEILKNEEGNNDE